MIKELKEFGIEVSGFDPLLEREAIEAFGIDAAEDIKGIGEEGGVDGGERQKIECGQRFKLIHNKLYR